MQTAIFSAFSAVAVLAIATPVALIMPPIWAAVFSFPPVLKAIAACLITLFCLTATWLRS
jgi:hypothetical protein